MPHRSGSRRSLIQNTLKIGSSTILSKILGVIRDILMIRFLGVSAASDAFNAAFRLPNSLRRIFAEGALSAAFIPTMIRVVKDEGQVAASRLITRMLWIVEGIVALVCLLIMIFAQQVIAVMAPGFTETQAAYAVPFLRVLIFFLFFISSSALFGGALQAIHRFFIPSFAQVVLNGVLIIGLLACIFFKLPVITFAWIIVVGGFITLLLHIVAYMRHQFSFERSDIATKREVRQVLTKFLPCIISLGMVDVSLIIDQQFASFFPVGSITLWNNASSFMRLPLSIGIVSFTTVLLPHLSRVGTYAPRRLSYYLFESLKAVIWVVVPIILIMSFFAQDIFMTLFMAENYSYTHVLQAKTLLIILLVGLFFFSINRIMVNMFYALHETFLPTLVTIGGTVLNTVLNFVAMYWGGINGIAWATVFAAFVQSIAFLILLRYRFNFAFYGKQLALFARNAFVQMGILLSGLYLLFRLGYFLMQKLPEPFSVFFTYKIGFWLWVGPLCGLFALVYFLTRRYFGIKLYFF